LIEWLLGIDPKIVTLLQFGSSTLLAAAGSFVGIVALTVAYRNNFGWPPIVMVVSYGMKSGSGPTEAYCKFDVWNRRKYSVAVGEIQVKFGSARISDEGADAEGALVGWYVMDNGGLVSSKKVILEPGRRYDFEASGIVEGNRDPFFNDDKPVEVWVDVFDPRLVKSVILRARSGTDKRWWRSARRRMPHYSSYRGSRGSR
jgi:hypothetical protein